MDGMNLGLFTGILHSNWLQGVYVLDEGLKEKLKFREHSHEYIGSKLKLNVVLNLCDAMMRAGTRIKRFISLRQDRANAPFSNKL